MSADGSTDDFISVGLRGRLALLPTYKYVEKVFLILYGITPFRVLFAAAQREKQQDIFLAQYFF